MIGKVGVCAQYRQGMLDRAIRVRECFGVVNQRQRLFVQVGAQCFGDLLCACAVFWGMAINSLAGSGEDVFRPGWRSCFRSFGYPNVLQSKRVGVHDLDGVAATGLSRQFSVD